MKSRITENRHLEIRGTNIPKMAQSREENSGDERARGNVIVFISRDWGIFFPDTDAEKSRRFPESPPPHPIHL